MIFRVTVFGNTNSFWKHKILDSNPMVSLETLLKKMVFDLMVTIPVHDAMTLSQDPIAVSQTLLASLFSKMLFHSHC